MKLRLPVILATALLSLMVPHIQAAPAIHYFMSAPTGNSFVTTPSSDSWHINTTGGGSGAKGFKFTDILVKGSNSNSLFNGVKISDLTNISFTTKLATGYRDYANLYFNIYTEPGTGHDQSLGYGSRLNLETAYAKGFQTGAGAGEWMTWSTADQGGQAPQLTIFDASPGHNMGYFGATLQEMASGSVTMEKVTRDYRDEVIKEIIINCNDTSNTNPGEIDLSVINITVKGQDYQWNFISQDYTRIVDSTEIWAGTFNQGLEIIGNTNAEELTQPVFILEGADANITLNGGMNMGEEAVFTIANITRQNRPDASPDFLRIDGAKVQNVENSLGRDSGLFTFECQNPTPNNQTPRLEFINSSLTGNSITAGNPPSRFGNLLGTTFTYMGQFDESTKAFGTKLVMFNVQIEGNSAYTTYNTDGGPQGTVYISSADAELEQVTFTDNVLYAPSVSLGGALCTWATNLKLKNSSFTENIVQGEQWAEGGALYYGDGRWGGSIDVTAIIENTSFVGNAAKTFSEEEGGASGGAIKLKSRNKPMADSTQVLSKTSMTLRDSVFTNNTAESPTDKTRGGAIFNEASDLTIAATKDMTYLGNAALQNKVATDANGGFLYLDSVEGVANARVSFDIAQNKTLTIGEYGKTGYDSIAGNAGSSLTKTGDGTLLVNSSMDYFAGDITLAAGVLDVMTGLASTGKVDIAAGASLCTGFTAQKDGSLSTTTGLGEATKVTIAEGGKLGTHLYNDDLANKWVVTYKELAESTAKAFAPYTGDGFTGYTYLLRGGVTLTESSINPGDTIDAGAGSNVDLGTSLPDNSVVISGGTVDASKVEGSLSDSQIKGSSGDLITSDSQEMVFTQSGTSGFNIHGGIQDGNMLTGANLVIAKAQDVAAEAPAVVLTGVYASNQVTVKHGSLEIAGDSAALGVQGGTVVVGNTEGADATTSHLINNATILSHVTVNDGSLLKGAGTFLGDVALAQGANLYVGNSPGRMDMQGGTFSVNGNKLAFCLDGYNAATKTSTGGGYYSNIHMQGGTLAWSGDNTLVLDLGFGLLATDTADVSFTLISGDSETQATGLSQESLDAVAITQIGALAGLLDETRLSWDSVTHSMVLDATLNTALIEAIVMEDGSRIANALWSSTRSVGNFAHVATSQLNAPRNGKSNVWVSGLGDFASVSGEANNGFDYNGGGYALGADYSFCKCFTGGLAFGQTFGTQKGDLGLSNIKQDGLMMALYGRSTITFNEKHSLDIDGYFTYGDVENKGDLSLLSGAGSSHAKWNDDVFGGGLKASWNIKLDATSTLTPFVGIDYLRGEQDSLNLGYAGGSSNWYGGAMQTWTVPVGITYKKAYSVGGDQYLVPEITIAYTGDVARQDPSVKTALFGKELKAKGTTPGRSAFLGNTGLRWIMDKNWSASAYYTIETRSDMTNQGVNASVNYTF